MSYLRKGLGEFRVGWFAFGLLFFGLLFTLAIVYYFERTTNESGYAIFCIINKESFCFINRRFIYLFTQWLPLVGVLLSLSLKAVLILFSISHVLFFFIIYLIVTLGLKDYLAGLSIILIQVVGMGLPLIAHPHAEIMLFPGLVVLLFAIMRSTKLGGLLKKALELIVCAFLITAHPTAMIFAGFVFILAYVETRKLNILLYLLAILIFAFYLGAPTSYEQVRATEFLRDAWSNMTTMSVSELPQFYIFREPLILIFFIATTVGLVFKRMWSMLVLFLLFTLGHLFLMRIRFGESDSYLVYINYPLVVFIVITFIYFIYKNLPFGMKWIATASLLVAGITGLTTILNGLTSISEGWNTPRRLIQHSSTLKGKKYISNDKNLLQDYKKNIFMHTESMLYSSITGPEHTIVLDDKSSIVDGIRNLSAFWQDGTLDDYFPSDPDSISSGDFLRYADIYFDQEFNREFEMWFSDNLNQQYFKVDGDYQYLNTVNSQTQSYIESNIRIVPSNQLKKASNCFRGMLCVPIKLVNKGIDPLFTAIENNVFITYRWRDEAGNILEDSFKTPIETDVIKEYHQYIYVDAPKPGLHHLTIGLSISDEFFNIGYTMENFNALDYIAKACRGLNEKN